MNSRAHLLQLLLRKARDEETSCAQSISKLQQEINSISLSIKESSIPLEYKENQIVSVQTLQFNDVIEHNRILRLDNLKNLLIETNNDLVSLQNTYVKNKQNTLKFEKLLDKLNYEFKIKQNKKEQKDNDDLGTQMFIRKKQNEKHNI